MSETRPVIGICTTLTRAQWGFWDRLVALLAVEYFTAVQRAGGLALMIPPDPLIAQDPDQALDLIDGLMLAGGNDVDPAAYGAQPHPETRQIVPARDGPELALARGAYERDMPVLGICRGMQVINVAFGGTLSQHLPDDLGDDRHRPYPGTFDGSEHEVRLAEGSLAALAAGKTVHTTNSHHHQAVDAVAEAFEVTGYSALDGLPEAIEAPDRRFVLGVQWHPEADEHSRVIGALVQGARDYRNTRVSA
jgi:putative glutamine amidotransferase